MLVVGRPGCQFQGLPVHAEQMLRINRAWASVIIVPELAGHPFTSEANHTLARWLLLQGNTGAVKGPREKFRSVLKRSCHVSSRRGEKKAEGQKRRVGRPALYALLTSGYGLHAAPSQASALINPLADLGSKALHKPSCAVEAGLKWQLKVRQMIANLREAQRHNMRVEAASLLFAQPRTI